LLDRFGAGVKVGEQFNHRRRCWCKLWRPLPLIVQRRRDAALTPAENIGGFQRRLRRRVWAKFGLIVGDRRDDAASRRVLADEDVGELLLLAERGRRQRWRRRS